MYWRYVRDAHVIASGDAGQQRGHIVEQHFDDGELRLAYRIAGVQCGHGNVGSKTAQQVGIGRHNGQRCVHDGSASASSGWQYMQRRTPVFGIIACWRRQCDSTVFEKSVNILYM